MQNGCNEDYSKNARLIICICLMLCILKGIFKSLLMDSQKILLMYHILWLNEISKQWSYKLFNQGYPANTLWGEAESILAHICVLLQKALGKEEKELEMKVVFRCLVHRIMAPLRCPHLNPWSCEYIRLQGKEI